MSEMSVSFNRSRTVFDHWGRLSRASRGVATRVEAGGEDGMAYGSPPRPVAPPPVAACPEPAPLPGPPAVPWAPVPELAPAPGPPGPPGSESPMLPLQDDNNWRATNPAASQCAGTTG